jgi:hypothetical protein
MPARRYDEVKEHFKILRKNKSLKILKIVLLKLTMQVISMAASWQYNFLISSRYSITFSNMFFYFFSVLRKKYDVLFSTARKKASKRSVRPSCDQSYTNRWSELSTRSSNRNRIVHIIKIIIVVVINNNNQGLSRQQQKQQQSINN